MNASRSTALTGEDLAGRLTIVAALLVSATGAIHAWIALDYLMAGLTTTGLAFLGMAGTYLGGLALYVAGFARRWILRLAPLYVLLLIVLWWFAGTRDLLAYVDKLVELVLLAVLGVLIYLDVRGEHPQLSGRPG